MCRSIPFGLLLLEAFETLFVFHPPSPLHTVAAGHLGKNSVAWELEFGQSMLTRWNRSSQYPFWGSLTTKCVTDREKGNFLFRAWIYPTSISFHGIFLQKNWALKCFGSKLSKVLGNWGQEVKRKTADAFYSVVSSIISGIFRSPSFFPVLVKVDL